MARELDRLAVDHHRRDNATVLLFLDFDGVLRRQQAPPAELEPDCLEAFESAVRWLPDVEIVITSTWREGLSLDELRDLFPETLRPRIVGVTPLSDSTDGHARHREVLAYLRRHALQDSLWIAIDDVREHYPATCEVLVIDASRGFDREAGRELVLMARRLESG